MKPLVTLGLLVLSNVFMTFAWYGHLKLARYEWFARLGLPAVVLISWGVAFFEYCLMVPANRIGFEGNGGPFPIWQLKVMQEVITLTVFTLFTLLVMRGETLRANHLIGFLMLVGAVFFLFKK